MTTFGQKSFSQIEWFQKQKIFKNTNKIMQNYKVVFFKELQKNKKKTTTNISTLK